MSVTIRDVAEHAGLSLGTISNYLNGGKVRPQNKKRIDDAIEALGFVPNEVARSLKTRRTSLIGVIIPQIIKPFHTVIISEIEDILRDHGYAVIICDSKEKLELEKSELSFLLNKHVDGLIISPCTPFNDHFTAASQKNIPMVFLDCLLNPPLPRTSSIIVDNSEATSMGTHYLLEKGHREIGLILGKQEIYTTKQRFLGHCNALKEAGVPFRPEYIIFGNYDIQSGYDSARALLTMPQKPSVLFPTSYELTIGAIKAINELGLRIPDDISLLGFDRLDFISAIYPNLSTVCQPHQQIALNAAEELMRLCADTETTREHYVCSLHTALVQGDTVQLRQSSTI